MAGLAAVLVAGFSSASGASAAPTDGETSNSPFTLASIRRASRAWEWKRLEKPGWKLLLTDHFDLKGDVDIGRLREAGVYLEEFLRMLRASIGGDVEWIRFSGRIFAKQEDLRQYAATRPGFNADSFYDPTARELVVCLRSGRDAGGFRHALAHEFTHHYMDKVRGCRGPVWFAEGMAEYFARFTVRDGRVHPGAVDRWALLLMRLDRRRSLTDLLSADRNEMYGMGSAALYAQAWSFVHYLYSRDDQTIDSFLRGESLDNVEVFEEGWRKHLKYLGK